MKIQYQFLIIALLICFATPIYSCAQDSGGNKKIIPIKRSKLVSAVIKITAPIKPQKAMNVVDLKKDTTIVINERLAETGTTFISLYTADAGSINSDILMVTKSVDFSGEDYLFYLILAMFLLLATVRAVFPKYFNDLFGLFSQSTFKQKSIREQLSQSAIPSFLLNMLFFFSTGLFLYFLTDYYKMHIAKTFEINFGVWIIVLIVVYLSKMLIIKLLGWLFQMEEACQVYNFIVFMVNKVMGVILLPLLLLLCFGPIGWRPAVVIVTFFIIAGLFIYRYIIAYPSLRPSVRLNRFHFFIYLCTFEILPLAIIYKEITVQFLQTT